VRHFVSLPAALLFVGLAGPTPAPSAPLPPNAAPPEIFSEASGSAGLDFVYFTGATGEFLFPEIMGGGGALFDYDGDGDLDLYAAQGALLEPGKRPEQALFPPPSPPRGRLFRNDLQVGPDGARTLRFTDVTAASRIEATGYGMGAATGDYDGDGKVDLYLTSYGPDRLLRNDGDGTFSDVTAKAGLGDPRWGVSATFFDYDRDGKLDLFVANYVEAPVTNNVRCLAASSRRDYCGPASFPPVASRLYRNRGDGTFEDTSARAGIAQHPEPSLGVVAFDADGDGWQDLYVANDGRPNQLWINRRDGTFRDDALLAGVALDRQGKAQGGMGVDAGDFDADGDDDLLKVNLSGETHSLYVNDGKATFEDRSVEAGVAQGSLPLTSFGVRFLDFDNDGWLDFLVASGAVRILEPLAEKGDRFPFAQTRQLYRNRGDGRFEEVTARAGASFQVPEVGRGVAFGDVDNDGDTDAVVFVSAGPLRLLLNQAGSRQPWLGLRLTTTGSRDALGARVELAREGGATLGRRVHSDGSYASASDPRLLFGLSGGGKIRSLWVLWPDGKGESFPPPPLGAYTTLRQGEGQPEPKP
jgi:hypothetical protein